MAIDIDIGFDLDAAIYTLHAEAIAAGAMPEEDPRAINSLLVALSHNHSQASLNCRKSPCKIEALCFALEELVRFRSEATELAPLINAADQTEDMRWSHQNALSKYMETLEWFRKTCEEQLRLERHLEIFPSQLEPELICDLPYKIFDLSTQLQGLLERFETKLRGIPWSFTFQQSNHKKRSKLLLTAVCQHLRRGGYKPEVIAEMVPDELGTIGAGERFRQKIKEPNACSFLPLHTAEKVRKDERRKRKSPSGET
jgi:hypothetical protein